MVYTSSGKEHITRMPAMSLRFSSMALTENGRPLRSSLLSMLCGSLRRLLIDSIGLRSCCSEYSSFSTLSFV